MLWPFHSFSCFIFHSINKIENYLAHSHLRLTHLNNWSPAGGTVRGVYRTFKAMKPCCRTSGTGSCLEEVPPPLLPCSLWFPVCQMRSDSFLLWPPSSRRGLLTTINSPPEP